MGDFASLYSTAPPNRVVSVEQEDPADVASPFSWSGSAQAGTLLRMPYLDAMGWAAHGTQWILLDGAGYYVLIPAVEWSDGDHYASYSSPKPPRVTVTANGKGPVKSLGTPVVDDSSTLRSGTTRDYVFTVATGDAVTVDVTATLSLRRAADGDARAPAHTTMRLHRSDSYPAVVDPTVRSHR